MDKYLGRLLFDEKPRKTGLKHVDELNYYELEPYQLDLLLQ